VRVSGIEGIQVLPSPGPGATSIRAVDRFRSAAVADAPPASHRVPEQTVAVSVLARCTEEFFSRDLPANLDGKLCRLVV